MCDKVGFSLFSNEFTMLLHHPVTGGGSFNRGVHTNGVSSSKGSSAPLDLEDDDYDEQELKDLNNRDKKAEKEEKKQKRLGKEYEEAFDGEDKLVHRLLHMKSKINIALKTIHVEDIITSKFKKISRDDTIVGLAGVVGEWGVVTPVHVLALETDDSYLLLDGLRRVFAAMRNGKEEVLAMVWDFSDKQEGKDMANVISLMVNRSQRYSPKEMWEQMKVLEDVNDIGPGLIEFLLQMAAGEAMKLKDVMLADMDYKELQDGLISGALTIDGAYKKLCTARKKENKLAKEDSMSIEEVGSGELKRLGIDEVKQLLELSDEDVGAIALEDMDRTEELRGNTVQDTKDRKPIDSAVKQATLIRDKFRCRACGIGDAQWLGILVYHNLIPVYAGGPDTVENGLTLCSNCHLTLLNYVAGKVLVRLEELSADEKLVFRSIFKYGNIAIEATKRIGMKKDDVIEAYAPSRRHLYPGENLATNTAAFQAQESLVKMQKQAGVRVKG